VINFNAHKIVPTTKVMSFGS